MLQYIVHSTQDGCKIVMSSGDPLPPRHTCLTLSLVIFILLIGGVLMGILYTDNTKLGQRLAVLEGEMVVMRELISQVETD